MKTGHTDPTAPGRQKILFVCSANLNRSRTAEDLLRHHPRYDVRSCGIYPESDTVCCASLVEWADIIICMEEWHWEALLAQFPGAASKRFVVLDIPDLYFRNDPHLILLLDQKLRQVLEDYGRP